MAFWHRAVVLLAIGSFLVTGCGGGGTPPAPTPVSPTVNAVTVTGAGAPVVGDTVQLTATASLSDGTTQNVTAQATWESSSAAIVTISPAGVATFVGIGDADLKATYKGTSGSSHVTCAAQPTPKYTLKGTVTDAINGKQLAGVTVTIADGTDAGRSTVSDGNGRYAIGAVSAGSFTLRVTYTNYATRSIPVTLSGDTTVDVQITAQINVTAFYGTYNVKLTILQQSCDFPFDVGPNGTFRIEGTADGKSMTVTIVERGTTRTYNGSIDSAGAFSGSGGGIIAGFSPPERKHEYNGSLSGKATGSQIDATEFVNFTIPCPGATMKIGYSGTK